jgi:hypothetical protein
MADRKLTVLDSGGSTVKGCRLVADNEHRDLSSVFARIPDLI